MTDLNKASIVACKESPKGGQQAITAVTYATAQVIATVPGNDKQWAECVIEVCNTDVATDFCIALFWQLRDATDVSGLVLQKVTHLQGVATVLDGRLMRGGTIIYAACKTAAATGDGTAGALNVYVRPFLLRDEE